MSARAITRHDNAPPLAERLELDHASLAEQATDVLAAEPLAPILVDEDAEAYSERAKALKGVAGMIEKARKAEKDQILKDGRTVDDFFKRLAKPVEDACNAIVGTLNGWQRRKLEEERERQRQEAERAKAEATPLDEEPAPPAVPIAAARVVSSATGRVAASGSVVWLHEVVDASLLPRFYLMVNEAALKAAVAAAKAEGRKIEEVSIPGVRVYEGVRTAIR